MIPLPERESLTDEDGGSFLQEESHPISHRPLTSVSGTSLLTSDDKDVDTVTADVKENIPETKPTYNEPEFQTEGSVSRTSMLDFWCTNWTQSFQVFDHASLFKPWPNAVYPFTWWQKGIPFSRGSHKGTSSRLVHQSNKKSPKREALKVNIVPEETFGVSFEPFNQINELSLISIGRKELSQSGIYVLDLYRCNAKWDNATPRVCESRADSVYQRAMVLLGERCNSSISKSRNCTPNTLVSFKAPPPGPHTPKYFYINQKKPRPMEPLKAWRGYHGNVYFQPIHIEQAQYAEPNQSPLPDVERCSKELRDILLRSRRSPSRALTEPAVNRSSGNTPSMGDCPSRLSRARSSASIKYQGPRQMSILDKQNVFLQSGDENLEEDLIWLMGRESTGSLCIDSQMGSSDQIGRHTSCTQPRTSAAKKRAEIRLCKGSVFHRLQTPRSTQKSMLTVCGDKYTQSQLPSTIMRSQTQYSHSSTRQVLSPDPHTCYSNFDKMSHLAKLRASMRRMDTSTEELLLQNDQQKKKQEAEDISRKAPYVRLDAEMRKCVNQSNAQNLQRHQRDKMNYRHFC
ncbi:hypothetical protein CAPTEDRAFT_207198 [Capitella teleta]|uniref:Uncharacterized protein n=1 Tax=Capitella teleta TaxID=283909 RepID=R7T6V3_CAPTE|nr:hypothetical protein CAPTEDRAFT_207198 [Capitella teleta]|eukprot:ELT89324.1 hypothetical protein CAPTEDRAFT_207198 [Capitella teleta]